MAQCHKRAFVNHPAGRLIYMDRAIADQKLVRRPPCSGVTSGAGLAGINRPLPAIFRPHGPLWRRRAQGLPAGCR